MKTLFLLLSLAITTSSTLRAQEISYFEHIAHAMQYYQDKQYEDAGKAFDLAFQDLDGISTRNHFYNAACAWSLAGNHDKAFRYLNKILNGKMIRTWDDPVEFYDMLTKDTDFKPIKSDSRWSVLEQDAERKSNMFSNGIKKEVADRIRKIGESDQEIRMKLDAVRKKDGLNSPAEKDVILAMRQQDSTNFVAFESIIKQYGWLGPQDVGYKNNQYLFLILQHADLPIQKKYLPLFKKSCKAGKVLAKDLAYLEDRINMREKKMQRYGSQTLIDKTSKKYILFPVADLKSVDRRRAMVGLESLKSYMQSAFGINFDIQQYQTALPELKKKYLL